MFMPIPPIPARTVAESPAYTANPRVSSLNPQTPRPACHAESRVDGAFGAVSSSPRAKTGGSAAAFALGFEVRVPSLPFSEPLLTRGFRVSGGSTPLRGRAQ